MARRRKKGPSAYISPIDIKNWGIADTERMQWKNGMPTASCDEWFVYLLRCRDGSLYTGITKDVARRCKQHNAGTASRYTRSRRPVALVYQEPQASQSLALKREAAIKAVSRTEKELLIRTAGYQPSAKIPGPSSSCERGKARC